MILVGFQSRGLILRSKLNIKDILEIVSSLVFWLSIISIFIWDIYTNGFTERVYWISGFVCCFLFSLIILGSANMDSSAIGATFLTIVIYTFYFGMLVFRLFQLLFN